MSEQSIIFSHINDCFQFAYGLIPDELQAQQLVVDAMTSFILEKKDGYSWYIEKVSDDNEYISKVNMEIKICLLKRIYKVGKVRFEHLKKGLSAQNKRSKKEASFLNLSFNERSLIFLKHQLNLPIFSIEQIMNTDKTILISTLYRARQVLFSEMGTLNYWNSL